MSLKKRTKRKSRGKKKEEEEKALLPFNKHIVCFRAQPSNNTRFQTTDFRGVPFFFTCSLAVRGAGLEDTVPQSTSGSCLPVPSSCFSSPSFPAHRQQDIEGCSHPIIQNSRTWSHLVAREAGKKRK